MWNKRRFCSALLLPFLLVLPAGLRADDMPAPPPTPTGPAILVLTSFDLPPAKISRAVALLKAYRAAATRTAGNRTALILQQIDWRNRFLVYESWKDNAAYEANQRSAAATRLCAGVLAIANGNCDRRSYYQVALGPHRLPQGPGTVYMMLHLDVFPSKLHPFFTSATRVAEMARKGRGNLFYDVASGVAVPWNYMAFVGAWRDRKAFEEYETSDYARQFRTSVQDVLGSPFDDRLYTAIK
jgi:quinol monooxygenase YgiN